METQWIWLAFIEFSLLFSYVSFSFKKIFPFILDDYLGGDDGDGSMGECLTPTVLSDESLSPGGKGLITDLAGRGLLSWNR